MKRTRWSWNVSHLISVKNTEGFHPENITFLKLTITRNEFVTTSLLIAHCIAKFSPVKFCEAQGRWFDPWRLTLKWSCWIWLMREASRVSTLGINTRKKHFKSFNLICLIFKSFRLVCKHRAKVITEIWNLKINSKGYAFLIEFLRNSQHIFSVTPYVMCHSIFITFLLIKIKISPGSAET